MSEKEQPPIMEQKLCVKGCGYFGSSSMGHMCSKCWKDQMSQSLRDSEGSKEGATNTVSLPSITKAMEEEAGAEKQAGMGVGAVGQRVSEPAAVSSSSTAASASPVRAPTTLPPAPPAIAVTSATKPAAPSAGAASGSIAAAIPSSHPFAATPGVAAIPQSQQMAVPPTAQALPATAPTVATFSAGSAVGSGAAGAAMAAAVVAAAAETPALPEQKNRKRCFTCSKKVGYTGIACRCNYVFCSLHRYPEQHDCTFDFKTSDRNDLKRTVVGGGQFSKVDRL